MTKEKEYALAHYTESISSYGEFGLKIMIAIDRPLTENDNSVIRDVAKHIENSIRQESISLDPEQKKIAEKEREELIGLFGSEAIYVEEIPNGYFDNWATKHLPWFVVTTKLGRIKIGWRKRVILIDWEGSDIQKRAEDIFPTEDVTKGDFYIHAWGLDKAVEYLVKLLNKLPE